jgi:4-amino-4-deoxy-L-arabinose transferase-like glycosyltransferase
MDAASNRHSLPRRWWLVLTIYVVTLYAFNLGNTRTFTGHEGFVAQAAREMIATGDWLVPRIGGKPWLEKPPLPHWCVAALGELAGGVDEFVARIPSVLAGLIGVWLVTSLAVRWFGPTRGLLTGLILATSFYTVTYARLAEADIQLWAIVLGGLWVFGRENVAPAGVMRWGRWLFFTVLGLTQLSKGPMFGAVVMLIPCVGFLGLSELPSRERAGVGTRMLRTASSFRWFLHPALLVCLVISIAWPLTILLRYPESAELWWTHTLGRVGGAKVLNPEPWWYYVTSLPWQLSPWTCLMLPALPSSLRRAWTEPRSPDRFLWLWFGLLIVALSAISAKHHHYLIYALPPCAFWAAEGMLKVREWAAWWCADLRRAALPLSAGLLALVVGLAATSTLAAAYVVDVAVLGTCAGLALAALLGCLWCQNYRAAGLVLFAFLWLGYGWAHYSIGWKTDGYRPETELLRRLDRLVEPGESVYVLGLEPSRLLLYSPRPLEVFVHPREFREQAQERPEALILTSLGHEQQLRKFGQPELVDQMPVEKPGKVDPFRQFVVYRMNWTQLREVTKSGKTSSAQLP